MKRLMILTVAILLAGAVGLFLPLHVAAAVDAKVMCRCGSRSVVGY